MADPPSYEESTSESNRVGNDLKTDIKVPLRFNIHDEVGTNRSQHVAALIAKLLPEIRNRAKQGLSKSTLLLLPSNQDANCKGRLVGYSEDDTPTLIQLEGRQDTLEFWVQEEAVRELQSQMRVALCGNIAMRTTDVALPEKPTPSAPSRSSFWSRKQSKKPAVTAEANPIAETVMVDVQLDEAHFRAETEYGLYETLRCRALLVTVEVR